MCSRRACYGTGPGATASGTGTGHGGHMANPLVARVGSLGSRVWPHIQSFRLFVCFMTAVSGSVGARVYTLWHCFEMRVRLLGTIWLWVLLSLDVKYVLKRVNCKYYWANIFVLSELCHNLSFCHNLSLRVFVLHNLYFYVLSYFKKNSHNFVFLMVKI